MPKLDFLILLLISRDSEQSAAERASEPQLGYWAACYSPRHTVLLPLYNARINSFATFFSDEAL